MKQQATVVVVLILAIALFLSGCSLVGLPGPSALTDAGEGSAALEDAAIAVTFPDGWLLESPPSVPSLGVATALEPDQRDLLVPLVTAMPPTRHDRCVVADIAPLVDARPEWQTLADVVAGFEHLLAADPRRVGLDITTLELPAGQTGRISWTVRGEAESVSTYIFRRADAWFILECVAQSVPPPDWRSIATGFEFLQEDE